MRKKFTVSSIIALALCSLLAGSTLAQYAAPRRADGRKALESRRSVQPRRTVEDRLDRDRGESSSGAVEIRRLIGTGPQTKIRTPDFRTNIQRTGARSQDWAQITVEYDTSDEWIDSMTFRYFVMSSIKRDGEREYSIYRKTVDYIDVEEGRRHLSSVYLRPATVKRQGMPVAVHVEILIDGKVVATDDDLDPSMRGKLPKDWWENREVLEKDTVTVVDDRLLNRKETPFALVNIDDYEVIR